MLGLFHPIIARWFEGRFGAPTAPQRDGWPRIVEGKDTLIAAPTGSGKTLAAFLSSLDMLLKRGLEGTLEDRTYVLYVSPLKALSNDVSKNLAGPLAEIRAAAETNGQVLPEITVAVRTGDTPQGERAKMAKRAPHILVTTPESLFIVLTSARGRERLKSVSTVIVDEIHAIADDKRGAHLSLSLERLDALVAAENGGRRPQRIGLSATQKPIEEIARLLGGTARPSPVIVDAGFLRDLDLGIEVPSEELGAVASNEMMNEVYDRIAKLASEHRTTLVFVNTRRLVERVAHQLGERIGADQVAAHHGSLSRQTRLLAEQRLKSAEIRVAVATASLELGIDIGAVELVIQIGSPRSIATFLQRVGRSGHSLGATPKGRLFALTRDQLVECGALIRAVRKGELDAIEIPSAPLDILAQQVVAAAASEELDENALFEMMRGAYPYRALSRRDFDRVLDMLAEGIASGKGRSRTYLHRDRVHGRVKGRKGARLTAITSGGAIPDTADYAVIAEPDETFVGTIHEDFAVESMAGDIFLLGNTSWRIRRVEAGRVRVENANGAPPTIPFWLGEAPARTKELSREVSTLRMEIEARIARGDSHEELVEWVVGAISVDRRAADQMVDYIALSRNMLGAIPSENTIIAERFFDESGGMQLVLHSPLGGRINRAWGLALRKCFCRSFNFELQAAATDDGIVLSLGPMHSFPLEAVFEFLSPASLEHILTQAVLGAPIFGVRWRWNAQRALAVPRHTGGKRVPAPLLRMRTDDLLAAVFPMQQACQENVPGDIELPEHPLVEETMANCLHEAMDMDGLSAVLAGIKERRIRVLARDTAEPSPLSHEILNANPYAYLDDAPLEERRARAVSMRRRGLHPELAEGVGALDAAAIATAEAEAKAAVRDADELHDLLLSLVLLPEAELSPERREWIAALVSSGRATRVVHRAGATATRAESAAWVAAERVPMVSAAVEVERFQPELPLLPYRVEPIAREAAMVAIVRGHMEQMGPTTAEELAKKLGVAEEDVGAALLALEGEGAVLRGRFRPGARSAARVGGEREAAGGENRYAPGVVPEPGENPSARESAPNASVGPKRGENRYAPGVVPEPGENPSVRESAPNASVGPEGGENPSAPGAAHADVSETPSAPTEWCDRRILARIHRLTIGRLRREIEPVTLAELMRFLFRWQHVAEDTELSGTRGTLEVLAQLQGLEVQATAWERDVLPIRVRDYDPSYLDALSFSGEIAWGRLATRDGTDGSQLSRAIPIALFLRSDLTWLLAWPEPENEPERNRVRARMHPPAPQMPVASRTQEALSHASNRGPERERIPGRPHLPPPEAPNGSRQASPLPLNGAPQPGSRIDDPRAQTAAPALGHTARDVLDHLERRGASFLRDLVTATKRLPAEVEDALRELVHAGLVTADGFSSLRALLDRKLGEHARSMHRDRFDRAYRLEESDNAPRRLRFDNLHGLGTKPPVGGRWSLLRAGLDPAPSAERWARQLLLRYGVVFRDLLARESHGLKWRDILVELRRMEARGEVRGGRFVGGFIGEQYALPDAVEGLRAMRKRRDDADPEIVRIAATDPLNLVGIIMPGPRVPAVSGNAVLYRNGVPIASLEAGRVVMRAELEPDLVVDADLRLRTHRPARIHTSAGVA